MKKIIAEFKKFITRGNVVDMAVGVIIGSAFTGVVNGLSNYVLKPIINWLLSLVVGGDALESVYTFLVKATIDGTVDLENSIYIDWGALINAIINFFLIAFSIMLFSRFSSLYIFHSSRTWVCIIRLSVTMISKLSSQASCGTFGST